MKFAGILDATRRWTADVSTAKIARLSLDHWLNNVCPARPGPARTRTAYEPVKGVAGVLSDRACRACSGTGRRSVVAKHNIEQLVIDMADSLDTMAAHAAGQTMKRPAADTEVG